MRKPESSNRAGGARGLAANERAEETSSALSPPKRKSKKPAPENKQYDPPENKQLSTDGKSD
jgi:hypothetical protein